MSMHAVTVTILPRRRLHAFAVGVELDTPARDPWPASRLPAPVHEQVQAARSHLADQGEDPVVIVTDGGRDPLLGGWPQVRFNPLQRIPRPRVSD